MRRSFTINKVGKRYRLGTHKGLIPYGYPIYSWLKTLSEKPANLVNFKKLFQTDNPGMSGIYAIFDRNDPNVCYYVGQSVNIPKRVKQHEENIALAKSGQQTLEMYKELAKHEINIIECHLDGFVIYNCIQKGLLLEVLTILEQYAMDACKPTLNAIPARKTKF